MRISHLACKSVDSHMCKEAIAHKIELAKQLGVVLQGTVKPSERAFFPPFPLPNPALP